MLKNLWQKYDGTAVCRDSKLLRTRTMMCFLPQGVITYRDAGVPEIWCAFRLITQYYSDYGAALITDDNGPWGWDQYTGATWHKVSYHIRASRCSPVYGRSSTVQPPTMVVNYFIRAK